MNTYHWIFYNNKCCAHQYTIYAQLCSAIVTTNTIMTFLTIEPSCWIFISEVFFHGEWVSGVVVLIQFWRQLYVHFFPSSLCVFSFFRTIVNPTCLDKYYKAVPFWISFSKGYTFHLSGVLTMNNFEQVWTCDDLGVRVNIPDATVYFFQDTLIQ